MKLSPRPMQTSLRHVFPHRHRSRRGNIILMSAWVLVMAFAFAAFTIDIGYIAVSKAQLQSAIDAATLAGAMELDSNNDQATIEAAVKDAVEEIAALNPVATWDGLLLDRDSDIELGRRDWDATNETFVFNFGPTATPYNIVRVTGRYEKEGYLILERDKAELHFFAFGHPNQRSIRTESDPLFTKRHLSAPPGNQADQWQGHRKRSTTNGRCKRAESLAQLHREKP